MVISGRSQNLPRKPIFGMIMIYTFFVSDNGVYLVYHTILSIVGTIIIYIGYGITSADAFI